MDEKGNGKTVAQEAPESVIVITFNGPKSAECNIQLQAVMPTQILAAAHLMQMMAERQIQEQWTQAALARARQAQEMAEVQQMISQGKVQ